MVELRKRKTPPPPAPTPARKKAAPAKAADNKAKNGNSAKAAPVSNNKKAAAAAEPADDPPAALEVGSTTDLTKFSGEIETHEGTKTTLKQLVEESKEGVVIFTYPKASTPGCTQQACLFRDSYIPLTTTGLSIYGLSTDTPKANSTFQTKQSLPYPLLCDPTSSLITPLGFLKSPKGTKRGVFVVSKSGKVLAAEPGGPKETVEIVRRIVGEMGGGDEAAAAETAAGAEEEEKEKENENGQEDKGEEEEGEEKEETEGEHVKTAPFNKEESKEDQEAAQTAGEVADASRIAHLDSTAANTPTVGTPKV